MGFDEVKERLRERCDIVDVINSYVPLKKAGANFKACCPFHNEKTPSFNVSPQKQMYYCFGCQKGGDVFNFVMEHEGIDFIGSMRILARFSGVPFDEDDLRDTPRPMGPDGRPRPRAPKDRLYDLHEKLCQWYQRNLRSEVGRQALQYVTDRGLNDDLLVHFGIGYAPDSWDATMKWGQQAGFDSDLMLLGGVLTSTDDEDPRARRYDRFRGRLMFPIWNPQGRIVGFSGRVMTSDNQGAKYVNTPETPVFHKGSILYALPLARKGMKEHGCALLCEGQMDVIACHAAGLDNAVAPQGTAFTEHQARILKRYTEHLVLAFDADAAGLKAARKSVESFLPAGLSARVVLMDEGEDPDSLVQEHGPEALKAKVDAAKDYFDFLLDLLCREHDPRSPQGSTAISSEFLEVVIRLPNRVARAEYAQRLAARLGIPESFAFQEMNAMSNRQKRQQRYRQDRYRQDRSGDNSGYQQGRSSRPDQRQDPPPFETGGDPAEAPRPAASMCELAEAVLLDIVLHHQSYAEKLEQELPLHYISDSKIGRALNEVLAHTTQGEWDMAEEHMRESMTTIGDPQLSKAIISPDFGPDADHRAIEKAYQDCRNRIMKHYVEEEIHELQDQLTKVQQKDEQQVLMRQIIKLQAKRRELLPGASA